jgi:hypothetical protein
MLLVTPRRARNCTEERLDILDSFNRRLYVRSFFITFLNKKLPGIEGSLKANIEKVTQKLVQDWFRLRAIVSITGQLIQDTDAKVIRFLSKS